MLLTDRCQVMLPNGCQCPNPIINLTQVPLDLIASMDKTKCLLHNQLPAASESPEVVDETTQRANSIPPNNTGE